MTRQSGVLVGDVCDVIGRMSGLQDTDASPCVYITEWYGEKVLKIMVMVVYAVNLYSIAAEVVFVSSWSMSMVGSRADHLEDVN